MTATSRSKLCLRAALLFFESRKRLAPIFAFGPLGSSSESRQRITPTSLWETLALLKVTSRQRPDPSFVFRMLGFGEIYLGLEIDTRLMQVIWPLEKRRRLATMIDTQWVPPGCSAMHQAILTPRDCASLLGLVRHGAVVSPEGNFLAIRLQHSLNDAIRDGLRGYKRARQWWRTKTITVPIDAKSTSALSAAPWTTTSTILTGAGPLVSLFLARSRWT
jgi:hypothetical protein